MLGIAVTLYIAAIGGLYVLATRHRAYYRGVSSILRPVAFGTACVLFGFTFGRVFGSRTPAEITDVIPALISGAGFLAGALYFLDDIGADDSR